MSFEANRCIPALTGGSFVCSGIVKDGGGVLLSAENKRGPLSAKPKPNAILPPPRAPLAGSCGPARVQLPQRAGDAFSVHS